MGGISNYTHIPQGRAKAHTVKSGMGMHTELEKVPEIPMVPSDHAPRYDSPLWRKGVPQSIRGRAAASHNIY